MRSDGNNSHTYADVNDDDGGQGRGDPRPRPATWNYRLKPFHLQRVASATTRTRARGTPNKPFSWKVNRNQNGAQVFYFVNKWHDHLLRTSRSGSPRRPATSSGKNFTRQGKGGDAVQRPDQRRRQHRPRPAGR